MTEKEPINESPKLNPETELSLLRKLLKDQIRLNKGLENKNYENLNKITKLETQNEELRARSALLMQSKSQTPNIASQAFNQQIDLETDMFREKINSQLLKAIVTPLETELTFVKKRLVEAEACLSISSYKPINVLPEVSADTVSCNGDSDTELSKSNLTDNSGCTSESLSDRARIEQCELYVLSLTKVNDTLLSKIEELNSNIGDLKNQLNYEVSAHKELKETWNKANEQFIIQSMNFQTEIQTLKDRNSKDSPQLSNSKEPRIKSASDNLNQTSEISSEITVLRAELSRAREELIKEKNETKDLRLGIQYLESDCRTQILKADSEFQSIDTLLSSIQQEYLTKQSLNPENNLETSSSKHT